MRQLLNEPLIEIGIILLNTDPGCRLHAILVFYANSETRQALLCVLTISEIQFIEVTKEKVIL